MKRLIVVSALGIVAQCAAVGCPDFAVLIGLSWLVLFGMHGLGCLLGGRK